MRKLRIFWQRIPRRFRILVNILSIAAAVFLIYVSIGCPPFTVKAAFRRAEKANLVGPGIILAELKTESTAYDYLVLADDGDGVILFGYDPWDSRNSTLVYRGKSGSITVAAAPGDTLFWTVTRAVLPVFVFDSYPDAVRAELELTLSAETEGQSFEKTYQLESRRENDGYFAFTLEASSPQNLGAEGRAIALFQRICSNSMADTLNTAFPATVRLYDTADHLIAEEALLVRSTTRTP